MVGVSVGGSPQGIPDIRQFTVLETLKSNVRQQDLRCRVLQSARLRALPGWTDEAPGLIRRRVQSAAGSFLSISAVPDQCAQERLQAQEAASEVPVRLPPRVLQLLESFQFSTARVRGGQLFIWQALGMPKHINMRLKRTEHMEVPVGFRNQPDMKGTERGDLLPRPVERSVRQG
jgi:hypothetical protein